MNCLSKIEEPAKIPGVTIFSNLSVSDITGEEISLMPINSLDESIVISSCLDSLIC